ncbi:MAG: response regulator [Clostridia bacterium]|nr:response regulator [Clostridia bacterium]
MYKMVIIDDEYFTCEGMKLLLDWKELNIEIVGTALNGEDGLKLVEKEKPDILMTDLRMKMMDGLTMIKKLRDNGYSGEIIVFSGYKVFEYAQEAMQNDVSCYLLKPVTTEKMIDAIKNVLKKLDEKRMKYESGRENAIGELFDDKWAEVIKYIDNNITNNITLKDVAGVACLEPTYFSRIFKKKTGIGFLEYITQQRMILAKTLLEQTTLHVKEIMYKLSYNDEKYFRQIFKNFTGYSPTEYRNMYKTEPDYDAKKE